MLDAICAHLHNYFTAAEDIHKGVWTIEDGTIILTDILIPGQYFRIVGSALNDGIYQYPPDAAEGEEPVLIDETFAGEIWAMRVPRALLKIAAEIEAWQQQYGAAMASPLSSESVIGVYSYTKASAANGSEAASADAWKDVFRSRLNEWRKVR